MTVNFDIGHVYARVSSCVVSMFFFTPSKAGMPVVRRGLEGVKMKEKKENREV